MEFRRPLLDNAGRLVRGSTLDRMRELVRSSHGTHRGWIRLQLANTAYALGQFEDWTRVRVPVVQRVVFVCLGNINRSAFAHALADKIGLEAASFGLATSTGGPAYEKAIATAPRFDVSLESHKATDISDFHHRAGDLAEEDCHRRIQEHRGHRRLSAERAATGRSVRAAAWLRRPTRRSTAASGLACGWPCRMLQRRLRNPAEPALNRGIAPLTVG